MNCERIQELILTDYLDKELNPSTAAQVEAHLSFCTECKEFLNAAKQTVSPLSFAPKQEFDQEKVWQNIKEQIESEHQPVVLSNPISDFISKLKESIVMPRPALLFSVLTVVVLTTTVFVRSVHHVDTNKSGANSTDSSLVYIVDDLAENLGEDNADYGTSIEEYFL